MQDLRLLVFAVQISCAPLVFLQRAVLVQEKNPPVCQNSNM